MIRKSLLTLVLLAFAGFVSAQSLQFELNGEIFADGQEITCTNDEYGYGEIIQHMSVRNITNNDMAVVIEKEIVEDMEGAMNTFCFGNCYGPETFISPSVGVAAQSLNEDDLSFHVIFEQPGCVIMKYYAYPEVNPDDKVSIVVKFVYDPTSVSETFTMGAAYPNPASTVVRFDVNCEGIASVALYNLLGQEVMTQDVENGQVVLSVADLNEGIYFCNLKVNGQVVKTEKFIVKK